MANGNFSFAGCLVLLALLYANPSCAQWTKKTDIGGAAIGRAGAVAFSANGKVYVGGGYAGAGTSYNDLQEYNPVTNTWLAKNNLPGTNLNRAAGISFSISGKIYMGLGEENYGTATPVLLKDLWQYDEVADTWTKKADLPDTGRTDAAVFVVNGKAYLVGGTIEAGGTSKRTNDVWEYDPVTNTWTAKAPLPVTAVNNPVAFVIDNEGYVFGGMVHSPGPQVSNKLYQYNAAGNSWTQKSSLSSGGMAGGVAFVLSKKAYCGLGAINTAYNLHSDKLYVYNAVTDQWEATMPPALPAPGRAFGFAVTIANKVYGGAGWSFDGAAQTYFRDFYFFEDVTGIAEVPDRQPYECYPNPAAERIYIDKRYTGSYTLYSIWGHKTSSGYLVNGGHIDISHLADGNYIVELSSTTGSSRQMIAVIKRR